MYMILYCLKILKPTCEIGWLEEQQLTKRLPNKFQNLNFPNPSLSFNHYTSLALKGL